MLDEENRVGLLRLAFKDTAEPGKSGSFSASLATEILDFMERMWGSRPTSIADKSYSPPPQTTFDEALEWLGQQFGLT